MDPRWQHLLDAGVRSDRVRHVEELPARAGERSPWPAWADPEVVAALQRGTGGLPWRHQVEAAEAVWAGRSTVLSAGTASGKSLAFQLPVLTSLRATAAAAPNGKGATALYLSPTKALAADQDARLRALGLHDRAGPVTSTYDGDTPPEVRRWIRDHAGLVLTNVDMLHRSVLPGHERWASFLRRLRFVVVDELHTYRGVFGGHAAAVLRRLRRIAARYGSDPVFVLASATVAEPATTARRLTGVDVHVVAGDTSARPPVSVALWEPPLRPVPPAAEGAAPAHPPATPERRTATAETADLLADLVAEGVRTLAFVRSRAGAESVAAGARRRLEEVDPALAGRVAAYRGGYLPEDRRALEEGLRSGRVVGMATTNALELGVDVAGLDAVLVAGWPGTRASFWQQIGRAGRRGEPALGVLVSRDDPLDTYLAHHPEAVFGAGVEATVLDPDNAYVLAPHLAAAAQELPLTEADLDLFSPAARDVVDLLVRRGLLRRRAAGWYWTRRDRACDLTDLRGAGGSIRVVEEGTGRVLGTVEAGSADSQVHDGAVHVHQGRTYVVDHLDLEDQLAVVHPEPDPGYTTHARSSSDVRVLSTGSTRRAGPVTLSSGVVEVTSQVTGFLRRRVGTGAVIGERSLDLPRRRLRTRAVWWTLDADVAEGVLGDGTRLPGALHAAEHASIGLLPLLATCDRWDLGGLSTALHEDTGHPTVFVHDAVPGGAGFADRGHARVAEWLTATRDAVAACRCPDGCPACVQSPKCGNGNEPLDKAGALAVLDVLVLALAPGTGSGAGSGTGSGTGPAPVPVPSPHGDAVPGAPLA
ncbi:DEAD/DEAH box helicase domain-containing protein [Kineococcus radiotolerans]|uniref:DEAD/DEAH box helicase domain-containing protein n=1 Tax=Kineococcus radiotolerans TaxID=131568 RepID=A0A7W4TLS9_KINRA|nr:DEAD/DEAH box helicase [Kineococcus radiotolerans]MBB2900883.1 DEAD/DEAH box helicase domain-containing protein [Kineococcus radiotolerans]